ncbi:hypothetical protein SAMN05216174_101720 [Actinokineospora iranica]|uniref:Uncharacterized protein n=2 Tax=Actinokineospora iranica TaxID=1271860 RepID=A0A1G6K4V9_9PSEU|nr:hypothetical protein SAMN05216174_101720 [Actinokineospora iranica]
MVATLLVSVPQGIVAVRQLTSRNSADAGGKPRRGVRWAVSAVVFFVVGIAAFAAMSADSNPPAAESGKDKAQPTGSAAPPSVSSPPSAGESATTTLDSPRPVEPAPVKDEITVPPPGCGASAGVDVHLDDPIQVTPGEKESAQADLEYDDCDGNIYPGSQGAVGLFTEGPTPTRDQCEAAARRDPIGDYRSIHTMRTGQVLCVITDENTVVAAEIRKLGPPFGQVSDSKPQPTITLALTRWPSQ